MNKKLLKNSLFEKHNQEKCKFEKGNFHSSK